MKDVLKTVSTIKKATRQINIEATSLQNTPSYHKAYWQQHYLQMIRLQTAMILEAVDTALKENQSACDECKKEMAKEND